MRQDKIIEAIEFIENLNDEEISIVMETLVMDEKINVPALVVNHVKRLERFKNDAIHDIRVMSQAGIDLGYPKIKKINGMKDSPKKEVAKAQAKILIDGGGYEGTVYGNEVKASVDTKSLDEDDWFKRTWALRTK